jgi:hypothetical protein
MGVVERDAGERRPEPLVGLLDALTDDLLPGPPAPPPADPAERAQRMPPPAVSPAASSTRPAQRPRRKRRRAVPFAFVLGALFVAGVLLVPGRHWFRSRAGHVRTAATAAATPAVGAPSGVKTTQFGWPPVPKATSYRVRFFRDGRLVFAANTVQPRVVLPARWRFGGRAQRLRTGTYHWVVQPGFDAQRARRYGKAIVSADWVAAR